MPSLQSYFDEFLGRIRLQPNLREQLQTAHQDLTGRLKADSALAPILVDTFLQGSYRRSTIVQPQDSDVADVDVVVVTRLSEQEFPKPSAAMRLFEPFLQENYPGLWEPQARSYGISLDRIKMDMVITSAPSESMMEVIKSRAVQSWLGLEDDPAFRVGLTWRPSAERANIGNYEKRIIAEATATAAWREEALRIPDRDQQCWEPTHPLQQVDWTAEKNRACDARYIDVVRDLKHWRCRHSKPKYPKGYPLEHLIGDACPDGFGTTAEGIVGTLETLANKWAPVVEAGEAPFLPDHGVEQNVLARVSTEDFARFHQLVVEAAPIARQAYEAEDKHTGVQLWQKLFGKHFPEPPEWHQGGRGGPNGPGSTDGPEGGFTPRTESGLIGGGRFG